MLLSLRTSAHTGAGIRSSVPAPQARHPFLRLPPAGYFCHQRQKYPKTPLETTFQDFLSALRPVSNLTHVPRAIGFSVYRCPSKGLCRHSFPLPLRCRCPLPRQERSPLPPYRGTLHPNSATLVRTVIPSQSADWRGNPFPPKPPPGALYIVAAQCAAPTFCGELHRKRRDLIIAHPTGREFPKGEGAHALSLWTLQGDGIFKGRGKFGIPLPLNGVFGYFCRC